MGAGGPQLGGSETGEVRATPDWEGRNGAYERKTTTGVGRASGSEPAALCVTTLQTGQSWSSTAVA
jgi:hypothetical protein